MLKKFLKKINFSESYVSLILGFLVVLVIGLLLLNFLSGKVKQNKLEEAAKTEATQNQGNFPKTHTVAFGETLWQIAENNYGSGYKWVDLAKENNLENPDYLEEGKVLTLPILESSTPSINGEGASISAQSYTVTRDDTLWDISVRAYGDGYQWSKIAQANNLTNPDLIHPGNVLTLPR